MSLHEHLAITLLCHSIGQESILPAKIISRCSALVLLRASAAVEPAAFHHRAGSMAPPAPTVSVLRGVLG